MAEEDGDDLSAARKKKLQENIAAMQQSQQVDAQKRAVLLKLLTAEAYERVMMVKSTSPELYDKVVGTLAYLAQNGQVRGKIDDETLVKLLAKMTERRETSIEFKRK